MKVSQISEEDIKKQKNRRKKVLITTIIGLLVVTGILLGTSYAYIKYSTKQENLNTVNTACLKIELTDKTKAITIDYGQPITDEEAEKLNSYVFTIKNTCKNTNITFDVNLEVLETTDRLKSEYIAASFNGNAKRILNEYPSATISLDNGVESYTLYNGSLKGNESVDYSLKLWIDEHVTLSDDAMHKNFESKIVVNATMAEEQDEIVDTYTEKILNGADPVLAENLIPVEISNTGVVTKADVDKKWYSYENKEWANAVILEDESITYENGEKIPESNIESYFVWIPKYAYKIQTLGTSAIGQEKAFEIKFGTTNTSDEVDGECTTPSREVASGDYYSGNCQVGDYMTHPAFIHFKDGIKGLWVGKFETGYKGATSTTSAEVNASDSSKVQIKPNVYSWRNITLSNMYNTAIAYKPELNSHMMKNTEWGAVAYLTNSNYGKCTNGTCTEIYNNNNSARLTGWSGPSIGASSSSTIGYFYSDSNSTKASTTGNYTGIYDMSGGTYEYVMGNSNNTIGASGFSSMPEAKYYDQYASNSSETNYTGRILGDATAETKGWFSDEGLIVGSSPWIWRGGNRDTNSNSGIFAFANRSGTQEAFSTFRILLAI